MVCMGDVLFFNLFEFKHWCSTSYHGYVNKFGSMFLTFFLSFYGSKSKKTVPFWPLEIFRGVKVAMHIRNSTKKLPQGQRTLPYFTSWVIIFPIGHLALPWFKTKYIPDIFDCRLANCHELPTCSCPCTCFSYVHHIPSHLSHNIIWTYHTHPSLSPFSHQGSECFETWSLLWHLVQQSQPLQARVHRDVERRWQGWGGLEASRWSCVKFHETWPSTNILMTQDLYKAS